ncbi:hypothetical protein B0H11DRAFT_2215163 [Mycena galericulata]|nr:hypothetical protein B0H11DRAFT_2215163 [Mycena galericulata]
MAVVVVAAVLAGPRPVLLSVTPRPGAPSVFVFSLAQVAAALGSIFVYKVDDACDAAFIALNA